jgi:hypothetical protein
MKIEVTYQTVMIFESCGTPRPQEEAVSEFHNRFHTGTQLSCVCFQAGNIVYTQSFAPCLAIVLGNLSASDRTEFLFSSCRH